MTVHRVVATGTNYYIDNVHGDDYHCTGQAETFYNQQPGQGNPCPWKTFSIVNQTTFNPGDHIYLQEGEIWTQDPNTPVRGFLHPLGSGVGTPTQGPIVIDKYCYQCSSSANPILNGNGDTATVELYNQQWWEISNLEITNWPSCAPNCPADRKGVWVHADDLSTPAAPSILQHIYLSHLTIHDVMGLQDKSDASKLTGGIIFQVYIDSTESSPQHINFDDVRITNNVIHDVHHMGIFFHSDWKGCIQNDCTTYPCHLPKPPSSDGKTWIPSTNVLVDGNTVHDVGGTGISIQNSSGQVISNNNVSNGQQDRVLSDGIITLDSYDAIVKNNQVSGWTFNDAPKPYVDAVAFDTDDCDIGATIEYNWSHDNQGGFLLLVQDSQLATVRYNISERDGYGGQSSGTQYDRAFLMHDDQYDTSALTGNGMQIYNNDVFADDKYAPPVGTSKGTALIPNTFGKQSWSTQPFFENNLVENTQSAQGDTQTSCSIPTTPTTDPNVWLVDYSDFYGGNQGQSSLCETSAPPQQPVITPYDPRFTNPSNGWQATTIQGVIADYTLSQNPSSPAFCVGAQLQDNGSYDFAGVALPSPQQSHYVDDGALEKGAYIC